MKLYAYKLENTQFLTTIYKKPSCCWDSRSYCARRNN